MKNRLFKYFNILSILIFAGAGCTWFMPKQESQSAKQSVIETSTQAITATSNDVIAQDTALSNPATVYCLRQNGKFTMKKTLNGSTEGYCTLPDGIVCEEWAFYKDECPAKAKKDAPATTTEKAASTVSTTDATTDAQAVKKDIETNTKDISNPTTSNTASPAPDMSDAAAIAADANSLIKAPTNNVSSPQEATVLVAKTSPGEEPGELTLSWETNSLDAPDGFIVMLSSNQDITYPTKYSHTLRNPQSHTFTWVNLTPNKTYYFRVCIAEGDSCKIYSQIVSGRAAASIQE